MFLVKRKDRQCRLLFIRPTRRLGSSTRTNRFLTGTRISDSHGQNADALGDWILRTRRSFQPGRKRRLWPREKSNEEQCRSQGQHGVSMAAPTSSTASDRIQGYRKPGGNIPDVKTLRKLLADMNALGYEKIRVVLDRGGQCGQH